MVLSDTLAEWLRRRPAKPMGSPCVGSNPTGVVLLKEASRMLGQLGRPRLSNLRLSNPCQSVRMKMTPAGLEPAIPGSVGRCLIHWATGPLRRRIRFRRVDGWFVGEKPTRTGSGALSRFREWIQQRSSALPVFAWR